MSSLISSLAGLTLQTEFHGFLFVFLVAAVVNATTSQKRTHSRADNGKDTPARRCTEIDDQALRLPSPELFRTVAAHCSSTRFRKGQFIFTRGADANALFAVNRGLVKLTSTGDNGKEVVIDIIAENDFFGEEALISPTVARHYNAVCLCDADIVRVDSKQLSATLRLNPDVEHMFTVYLLHKTRALQEHVANCLLNSGTKRLMHTLTANEGRLPGPEKLDQQTLGEMIGMTRQYVNFLLRDLRLQKAPREESSTSPSLKRELELPPSATTNKLRGKSR